MLINLTDFFLSENKKQEWNIPYNEKEITFSGEKYSICLEQAFSLILENTEKGKARIQGTATAVIQMQCDRCLSDVNVSIPIQFIYEVNSPDMEIAEETRSEQPFISGYQLDTDVLLNNEILILWPMKVLCHESCKGICPMCGRNLNDGECGCDRFVPDPRMAKIKDIFNANKEV